MQVCIEGIRALELGVDGRGIADHLTHLLARRLPRDISREDRPSAMLAIYSPAHRTVWQIGDVRCWYSGLEEKAVNRKSTVDTLATEVRVAVLRAELASGASPADLARDDPGRDAILGVLRHQSVFRNNAAAAQWAYSSIDGAPVPPELIRAYPVPPDVTELVLASDGYPRVQPTLEASEMTLKELWPRTRCASARFAEPRGYGRETRALTTGPTCGCRCDGSSWTGPATGFSFSGPGHGQLGEQAFEGLGSAAEPGRAAVSTARSGGSQVRF